MSMPPVALTLCLACSASLPPSRLPLSSSQPNSKQGKKGLDIQTVFITACCRRPICPACIASNPRLARYNPCLHCLGGVDVLSTRRTDAGNFSHTTLACQDKLNIDGGLNDDDVFAVGFDEDEEEPPAPQPHSNSHSGNDILFDASLESPSLSVLSPSYHTNDAVENVLVDPSQPGRDNQAAPLKHYIQPGDTLVGIALKYKIDVSAYHYNGYQTEYLNQLLSRAACFVVSIACHTVHYERHHIFYTLVLFSICLCPHGPASFLDLQMAFASSIPNTRRDELAKGQKNGSKRSRRRSIGE